MPYRVLCQEEIVTEEKGNGLIGRVLVIPAKMMLLFGPPVYSKVCGGYTFAPTTKCLTHGGLFTVHDWKLTWPEQLITSSELWEREEPTLLHLSGRLYSMHDIFVSWLTHCIWPDAVIGWAAAR